MCEATQKQTETDGTMSSLSQTFSYDFEDRLTSWASNGTTLNQTQSWNLSLEGAWNSTTVNGYTETRTFNQTYETLFSNATPMSHDRKGNLTQNKDGSLYTWDFDNQLSYSTAGTPSVNAAYAYDALGRRVSKSSGNTITVFVHSNYQIATEYKSINGGALTENQSFVYATYIDDPIALISTNGTYFYHSNQQYSIAAITDSNGNLSECYGYNAYGKPVIITDSILVDNPYFFTGRQLDSETGLFYFRARYYDASLGQFILRDPIGFVDGMSLYRGYFVANGMDPFGYNDLDPLNLLSLLNSSATSQNYTQTEMSPTDNRRQGIDNIANIEITIETIDKCDRTPPCCKGVIEFRVKFKWTSLFSDTSGNSPSQAQVPNTGFSNGMGGYTGIVHTPGLGGPVSAGTTFTSTGTLGSIPCSGGQQTFTQNLYRGGVVFYSVNVDAKVERCGNVTKKTATLSSNPALTGWLKSTIKK